MVGCNMDCLNCPHPDCINPNPVARYPSWDWANRSPEYKEGCKQRARKRRETLKAQGYCVCCGKVPAREGKTLCTACAAANSERRKKRYRAKLEKEGKATAELSAWLGICRRSGCECKVVKGKKYCEKHYAEQLEYVRRATEASKRNRAKRKPKH